MSSNVCSKRPEPTPKSSTNRSRTEEVFSRKVVLTIKTSPVSLSLGLSLPYILTQWCPVLHSNEANYSADTERLQERDPLVEPVGAKETKNIQT